MSFKLKCVAASVMMLASSAVLAGGANFKDYKDNMPCPVIPVLMDGFYVGAQVGHQNADMSTNVALSSGAVNADPDINVNGWLGGLFLGYGKVFNSWYYLGGEIFGNYANSSQGWDATLSGPVGYSANAEMNSSYGLAILPGLKLTDATLTYIRLGYTWANFKYTESASTPASASNSSTEGGFAYGVGMETLITGNWSLRGEYTYTNYNNFSTSMNATSGTSINPSASQYTLGLIYHF